MISIPYKTKQFLVLASKIIIVVGAFYFIYDQLVSNDKLDWKQFLIVLKKNQSVFGIGLILYMSFQNRFLEILKWQNLVSTFQIISIGEATKEVLAALTAGLFTPNGVGEYAGKALYYEKSKATEIVFLNFVCNGIQLLLTVFFGMIGLLFLGFRKEVALLVIVILILFTLTFFTKKIEIKGYSIGKMLHKIGEIPKKIHAKNNILAVCRYLTFSHQTFFLFLAFDVQIAYLPLIATIMAVYFLASSLPNFQFLDFAVKGSLGIYFYGLLGVNEWIVVFVTTLMWFLNVVLPVAIGSFYVLKFKPKWN
jgi:hypothetical protein